MKEINLKNNCGLKIHINGVPDIKSIPEDVLDSFIKSLSLRVYILYEKKKEKSVEKRLTLKK